MVQRGMQSERRFVRPLHLDDVAAIRLQRVARGMHARVRLARRWQHAVEASRAQVSSLTGVPTAEATRHVREFAKVRHPGAAFTVAQGEQRALLDEALAAKSIRDAAQDGQSGPQPRPRPRPRLCPCSCSRPRPRPKSPRAVPMALLPARPEA